MDLRRSATTLSERDSDALLAGRAPAGHDDLQSALALLRSAVAVPAPPPNAALSVVLRDGLVGPSAVAAVPVSPWRRRTARAAVAVTAALSTTLLAATANALPAPVQTAVADVVVALTPLELPRPGDDAGRSPRPSDEPAPAGTVPTPSPAPERTVVAPGRTAGGPTQPSGAPPAADDGGSADDDDGLGTETETEEPVERADEEGPDDLLEAPDGETEDATPDAPDDGEEQPDGEDEPDSADAGTEEDGTDAGDQG